MIFLKWFFIILIVLVIAAISGMVFMVLHNDVEDDDK